MSHAAKDSLRGPRYCSSSSSGRFRCRERMNSRMAAVVAAKPSRRNPASHSAATSTATGGARNTRSASDLGARASCPRLQGTRR